MAAENLVDLLSTLKTKTDAIARDVQAARDDVSAANAKIASLEEQQKQAVQQVQAVQARIAGLAEGQAAKKAELRANLTELQGKVRAHDGELAATRGQLKILIAANNEDKGRKQLESEKSLFLIRIRDVAAKIADGAVRCVFVERALQACIAREITPEKFLEPSNQSAVAEGLADLRRVGADCSDDDRREGALFEQIEALSTELQAKLKDLLMRAQQETEQHASLVAERNRLDLAIRELERPETAAESKGRRIRWWIGCVGGAGFVVAGAAAAAVAAAPVVGPLVLIGAVPCLAFAWWNSDHRRASRLQSMKKQLSETKLRIDGLQQASASEAATEASLLPDYRRRLAHVGAKVPESAGKGSALADLSSAASVRLTAWIGAHSDAKYLPAG